MKLDLKLREKLKDQVKYCKSFAVNKKENETVPEYTNRISILKTIAEENSLLFLEFLELE